MTRGIGSKTYQALIERFGSSEAILNAPREELEAVQGIGPKLATAVIETSRNIDIASEINLAKEKNVQIIPHTSDQYPKHLKAIYDPPKDTRAYFRGMCLQRYADEIVSASWDSVIFDLKEGPLKKIFMLEPLRGTEAHVRALLTESPTAADLLRNISRAAGM